MAVFACIRLFGIFVFLTICASAPPSREVFGSPEIPPTSTQLTLEDDDGQNTLWEDDDDVFDLDGDSWLNKQSVPLSTWPTLNQSPKPEEDFDDSDEDNTIDDDNEEETDDLVEKDDDENSSEFLLVPASSVDKRNLKVRHTGRTSDEDDFLEDRPEDVVVDGDRGNYDLVSFNDDDVDDEDDTEDPTDEEGDNDNNIFAEKDDDDTKKMMEDKVFLF